ncbi:MAG: DUF4358 domain-containing protein [Lachnospiraceae bacterium]|nr:DUF4358 domain-containing protein [Lachnospiraceae bacterium]
MKKEEIMKKLVIYLCVGVMALGLTACGSGEEDNTTPSTETTQSTATEEAQGTEDTTATEEGIAGSEMDVANGWSEEMNTIKTAVVDALGEGYWPNTPIVPEMLEGTFGISSDMYSDYMGEIPMISTNVDTLLIIKANDDKVEAVETALNTYRDNLIADTMQYPQNVGKIQASRIEKVGNYVCFVQLGGGNLIDENVSEEQSIIKCQEQNELAIEVIGQNLAH